MDEEKVFDKSQHPFMIKTLKKLELKELFQFTTSYFPHANNIYYYGIYFTQW